MQAKGMGVSLHPAQAVWLAKAAVERAAGLRSRRERSSSAVIPNPVSNCAWVRPLNWESMADCSPMRFFFRPSGTFSFPATDPRLAPWAAFYAAPWLFHPLALDRLAVPTEAEGRSNFRRWGVAQWPAGLWGGDRKSTRL